jgi:hypothetical protein
MLKTLNLIRSNRSNDLQQAGIPKVVLAESETVTASVDAGDTISRIMGIPD